MVLLALFAMGDTHAAVQDARIDNLTTARDFLRVAYPTLAQVNPVVHLIKRSRLVGAVSFATFEVIVGEDERSILPDQPVKALLSAEFTFGDFGRIERYYARGRVVRDDENMAFAHDVEQHPDWSDEKIASELVRRGARFGPHEGDALTTWVLPRNLEPMLGELTPVSATFRIPTERERRERLGGADLHWIWVYQSSSGLEVWITLEPFSGGITSVDALRPAKGETQPEFHSK